MNFSKHQRVSDRGRNCATLLSSSAWGQPSQAFDVAAIRPNLSGSAPGTGFDLNGTGRLRVTNATLKFLIQSAYRIQSDQIAGGPGWLDSDRYDIDAKTEHPEKIEPDQLKTMLQNLLADRFRLRTHREAREMTVYALVADNSGKTGAKMKQTEGTGSSVNTNSGPGKAQMTGTGLSMEQLASYIGNKLGRVVLDKTGLKDVYDLTLESDPAQTGDSEGPSLFTALREQAGARGSNSVKNGGPVQLAAGFQPSPSTTSQLRLNPPQVRVPARS